MRPLAPSKKKLKAGYIPSRRYFDWGRNSKHNGKMDAHYLTPSSKIPKEYSD
jgi:hypothetical protein